MMTRMMTLLLALSLAIPVLADPAGIGGGPHETSLVGLGLPDGPIPAAWGSLFVLPDGSGPGLAECFVVHGGGALVDMTVHVTVLDAVLEAIPDYPADDLWLEGVSSGLVVCGGSYVADGPSDNLGLATFTRAPAAGGWNETGLRLYFNGMSWLGPDLPIRVNSADIDGDGRVNLTDTGLFTADLFVEPYRYRSDYNADGFVNLTDAGFIARNLGVGCP